MRPTSVVVLAALIAAGALVALTGPADSRATSPARTIAADAFRPIAAATSVGTMAMTTSSLDPAYESADSLEPDTPLGASGQPPLPSARPRVNQPAVREGVVEKNTWRLDPNVSFYGPGFYGKRTACGQAFTTTLQGVAHRTLPCGTRVTFRNPANGRTITLAVIDRGPYVDGRQWDLSGGACRVLDACRTGPLLWRLGRG